MTQKTLNTQKNCERNTESHALSAPMGSNSPKQPITIFL